MRNRYLAVLPLAALLLTACASATDATPLTTPTPEPTATATPTPAAGDFAWLNRLESSFNSGDAYYEMVYRNHGGLLLKTDYATAAQTVVCTVLGCTHDSADCPAWFPGRYRYYCPFVADGAVYVLNASFFHTDQTWEEYREEYLTPQLDSTDLTPEELEAHYYGLWQQQSAAPQVYRLTDDGKTCIDLPAECVDYVFDFCDDAALYGVKTSGTNGQNTKAVRVDLTTGELQSVPLEPTEYFVTCYDGALLTVRYVTDAPLPDDFEQFRAAVQSATVEFDRYDPRTGERRKLIERPYNIADERLPGIWAPTTASSTLRSARPCRTAATTAVPCRSMTPPTAAPPRCGTRPRPAACGIIRTPTRTSCPPGAAGPRTGSGCTAPTARWAATAVI